MTLTTIIVLVANSLTAIIAAALLMLVLWQAPGQRANQYFAFVMLMLGVYSVTNALGRFIDDLNLNPEHHAFFAISIYTIFITSIFFFASEFAHTRTPTAVGMRVGGVLLTGVSIAGLWTHRFTTGIRPTSAMDGSYQFDWALAGQLGSGVLALYLLASVIVIYRMDDPRARSLWVAPMLVVGYTFTSTFIWPILPLPIPAVFLAASALALGWPVLRHEIFNPMVQMHAELAEKNAALEEANRLKGEFLANMSHELRTPLNSIIGYTELVVNGTYGTLNDTQRDRLEKVIRNGRNLLGLINDVLDLSRIESGRVTLERRPVSLAVVLDSVLTAVEPLATQKGLTITREFTAVPPAFGDETRIRQIVTNIVANAIKFTDQGGVTVRAARTNGMIRLEIADTGIGIAPDQIETVFAEFQQVDNSSTRRYEGTGLGMAITRRLVELHRGKIWLESAVGVGTTFFVTLPAAQLAALDTTLSVDSTGSTVLVIDDNPDTVQLLSDVLLSAGYRILTAQSGPEGLAQAHGHHPDLIVLDIMMPGMDGWQVLRALKDDPGTRAIPVVIVSVIDNRPMAIGLGAHDSLTKPLDPRKLFHSLEQALVNSRSPNPILVVDNRQDDRDLIVSTLESRGYHVVAVSGGAQAIEWLSAQVPSLVVVDLLMPVVNGFDVLAAMRANDRLNEVPVVVITAKDLSSEEQALLRQSCASLVQKGFAGPDVLLSTVQKALVPRRAPVR